jgi:hypothetical protein
MSKGGWSKDGGPRKHGCDPFLGLRAPPELIETVKARAAERNVAFSVIVREALVSYVGNGEGRDRGVWPPQETVAPALEQTKARAA